MSTQHKYEITPSERLSLQSDLPLAERWPDQAPPLTNHAIGRYAQRLPGCAIEMPLAWLRGEDLEHPGVLETYNHATPTRARVYNHADQYRAVFIVGESSYLGEEAVLTVYNGRTHEHAPTRAYLAAHGPHHDTEADR